MLKQCAKSSIRLGMRSVLSVLTLIVAACAGYDVSLNDRLIYTPKELFTDFTVKDTALHDCVSQTLEYQKATSAAQLATLNCSGAGISRLDGLSTFSNITHLKLSVNKLTNIDVLASLSRLRVLHLDENQLDEVSVLSTLPELEVLSVKNNSGIDCAALISLKKLRPTLKISFPQQCSR